ncbi:glucosyltransferase domain-containing protein [Paenibacillus sp. CH40]|uniref:glucosyltransferase domain-containing protein n=1 Tax=Paenibacillus sp. CH40 TaxID=2962045 RepID=UPI0020B881F7|nr:glucosyltransferase domain-containing protein [Paenibacillus sp. CH40]MCP3794771.1 glucosyltransferase domain-containing protein [Paenibacillus sp. CH40]
MITVVQNQRRNSILFICCFFTCLLFYGIFINPHYAVDTYVYTKPVIEQDIFRAGRLLTFSFLNILGYFNVSLANNQSIFTFLSIVFFSLSHYLFLKSLLTIKSEWTNISILTLFLASVTLFNNVFMATLFIFPEVIMCYSIGTLLCVIAVNTIVFGDLGVKKIMISLILIFATLCFYQGIGPYYVMLAISLFFLKNWKESMAKVYSRSVMVVFIYTVAILANSLLERLSSRHRTDFSLAKIFSNIWNIIKAQKMLWIDSDKLIPQFIFIIIFILLIVSLSFIIFKDLKIYKTKGIFLFQLGLIFLTFLLIVAPFAIANDGFLTPRGIVVFMAFPSILGILFTFLNCNSNSKKSYLSIIYIIIFICVSFLGVQNIGINNNVTNALDKAIAQQMYNKIERYETLSNKRVTKIALVNDTNPTWSYVTSNSYDIHSRALSIDWAALPLLSVVTGREFEMVEMDKKIYNQYFLERDWNSYEDNQVIIKGDTAYIALY